MFPKLLTSLVVLLLTGTPDEGQWLPTQVREMDWRALEARGMELTRDEFWHPEEGGVLSAAVHINGCTASFVSPEGLVITNHHCGFGAISALSTVEDNHLENGFVAADRSGELPAPNVVVKVLRKIEDVTDRVHAAQEEAGSDLERWVRTRQVIAALEREGEQSMPNTECEVAEYLEGREYHLIYRRVIPDVRLVYAPPRAVGEFGGEVDNWEWPRHTGDFSVFRAYVAPDGSSRGHHEDNVPFEPGHHLRVSSEGVQEGDLAIIMGYPGRTQRYLTSAAVRLRQEFTYPKRDEVLDRVLAVLRAATEGDPELALGLSSRIKSLANVEKNAEGMVWGLDRNAVVARKLREEEAFRQWVAEDPDRQERYGTVLDDMLELARAGGETIERDFALGFLLGYVGRSAPLLQATVSACSAQQRQGRLPGGLRRALAGTDLTRDMERIQRPILAILFDELRQLGGEQAIQGTQVLGAGPVEKMTGRLLGSELVGDPEVRVEVLGDAKAIADSDDPFVVLCRGLAAERAAMVERNRELQGRRLQVGRLWIEAQEEWRGEDFYPDANGTLRVSIGEIKGYRPRDGVRYTPHTTVAGVVAKEKGESPFASPEALLQAAQDRQESRFFDDTIGDVPVCFLMNGDTTGGNSGSPVINGRGELVGLNFDRVFENVSGDFGWNAARSRNICVDIRYVLWIMESVLPAKHLLTEMDA